MQLLEQLCGLGGRSGGRSGDGGSGRGGQKTLVECILPLRRREDLRLEVSHIIETFVEDTVRLVGFLLKCLRSCVHPFHPIL